VHFHAVIRVDGAEPTDDPPAWADTRALRSAVRAAAAAVRVEVTHQSGFRELGFGAQVDVRAISAGSETRSPRAVAAYLAKYATKAAEVVTGGVLSRRLTCLAAVPDDVDSHVRRLVETCWHLGADPQLEHLRLREWAHMLGFGGHFSTRSRRYSTTLTALRRERVAWRLSHQSAGSVPTAITGPWHYVGMGYANAGDKLLAVTAARDRHDALTAAREHRRTERPLALAA